MRLLQFSPIPAVSSGRKEKLWREFFSDPSQWWDHRSGKVKLIMTSVEIFFVNGESQNCFVIIAWWSTQVVQTCNGLHFLIWISGHR
jgi:hypothetical protein